MPFKAVLDTCVLYPAHLRDTLLRLAERDLYKPLWSKEILDELAGSLAKRINPESVQHLLTEIRSSFPEAEVTEYESLTDSMECDPKDQHVLAVAVRSEAGALVTFNMKGFPDTRYDSIEIIHPTNFLLDLLDLSPLTVIEELRIQAQSNRREPKTLTALLDALNRNGLETFTEEVRRRVV